MTDGATRIRPDGSSDLADGVVVQAQLLGRVLGLRVLRVDGTVLLSPASVRRTGAPEVVASTAVAPRAVTPYPNGELAEAARLLRESDEVLRRRPG